VLKKKLCHKNMSLYKASFARIAAKKGSNQSPNHNVIRSGKETTE
jgi:hypothetical protein